MSVEMLLVGAVGVTVLILFANALVPAVVELVSSIFDEFVFYWYVSRRHAQIKEISQSLVRVYSDKGLSVNIMVWNRNVKNKHCFTGLVDESSERMGNVWGFRVEVFTGGGTFDHQGRDWYGNFRATGNYTLDENVIRFNPAVAAHYL